MPKLRRKSTPASAPVSTPTPATVPPPRQPAAARAFIVYRAWAERLAAADGALPDRLRYTRKSTAGDERQVASHDQQAQALDGEFTLLDGPWWWQDSHTGTTFDRPAFQDMLAFCRAHPRTKGSPGRIEIYDPSRFGRTLDVDGEPDVMRWQRTYIEFEELHWQVHFVAPKRTGNVMLDAVQMCIHAFSAALFSATLARNVRRGRVDHASRGWWVHGSAPWGTKRQDTRTGRVLAAGEPSTPGGGGTILVPDPAVLKHSAWTAKRVIGGASLDSVGDELFHKGLRGSRGGRLGHRSIRNWLTNVALIGQTWYRDQADVDGRRPVRVVDARWDAMVNRDVFEQVGRRLDGHSRADRPRRRRERELYPLTPVCAHCGIEYNGNRLSEKQGNTRGYTHAGPKERMDEAAYARMVQAGCKAWHVDAEELEDKIKDVVLAARTSSAFVGEVRALLQQRDVFRRSATEAVEAAERQLKEARRAYSSAARLMTKVGVREEDEDAVADQILGAKQRVRAAEEEFAKATRFARSKEEAWTRLEGIVHETRNLAATWHKAGPHERRILFDYWVLDVVVVVEPIPGMRRANHKTAIITLRTAPDAPLHFDISGPPAQRVTARASEASRAANAVPSCSITAGSSSRAKRPRRAAPAAGPPTRPSAQAACARTSGSSSASAAASAGTSAADPTLPSTTAAFRLSPRSLARFIGDPRNAAENSSCDMPNRSSASVRASLPAMNCLGANGDPSGSAVENLWVYGHTSWQTSHPYSRSPTPARSASGIAPSSSMVR